MEGFLSKLPTAPSTLNGWPWTEETNPIIYSEHKDWQKITIITPSFNQGQYIEETIRSVLLQNYPNLEYIIIDGGSTDDSVEIIKKYEPWLSYWVSEKDRGQSHAINKGLEKATGDIIQWINSDDVLCEKSLYVVGAYFRENPKLKVMLSPTFVFGMDDRLLAATPIFSSLSKTISAARINQPGTFFRADIFKFITPLNEDLHYMMDLHIWLNYLVNFGVDGILIINDVLVKFREHGLSKTISLNEKFIEERFFLLNKLQLEIRERGELFRIPHDLEKTTIEEIESGINDSLFYWIKKMKVNKNQIRDILINWKRLKNLDKIRYLLFRLNIFL